MNKMKLVENHGKFYEVDRGLDEEHYLVYPKGGGFALKMKKAECREVKEVPADIREGHAYIDEPELSTYPCMYDHNYYWNGWRCPGFEDKIIEKMLEHWKMKTVSKTDDKWVIIGEYADCDEQRLNRRDGRWYFDGWCWTVVEDLDTEGNEEFEGRKEMPKGVVEPYPAQ